MRVDADSALADKEVKNILDKNLFRGNVAAFCKCAASKTFSMVRCCHRADPMALKHLSRARNKKITPKILPAILGACKCPVRLPRRTLEQKAIGCARK